MNKYEWLILCLGNPGSKYAGNRHNIGWQVGTALVEKKKHTFSAPSSIYYFSEIKIARHPVAVALPTTYMNASGEAARKLLQRFELTPSQMIVVVDEYNFELGKVHLRKGGSDGGHNGVMSVIEEIGSDDFYRLRCGIGKNFPSGGMVDYVLANFTETEIPERDAMVKKAINSLEYFVANDASRAMSFVNSGKLWNDDKKKKPETSVKPITEIPPAEQIQDNPLTVC